jgi:hypothetical protein
MKRPRTVNHVESPSSTIANGSYDNKKPRNLLESTSKGCDFESSLLHFEKKQENRIHDSVTTQRNAYIMASGIVQLQNPRRMSMKAPCEENEESSSDCASESSSFFRMPLEYETLKQTPLELGVQDESLEEASIKTELSSNPTNTLYQEAHMISAMDYILDPKSCIHPMKQSWSLNTSVDFGSYSDKETVYFVMTPADSKGVKVTNMSVSDFIGAVCPSSARFLLVGALALVAVLLFLSIQFNPSVLVVDPNSMYLPGAGFSGFWFTLGRLESIPDPTGMTYYCFSAGCLAAVSTLSNLTREELSTTAFDIQNQWRSGEIHRHQVVSVFLDSLLYPQKQANMLPSNSTEVEMNMRPPLEDPFLLSRLQIITTVKRGWFGLDTVIRSPKNVDELREMLLQTTWM